MSGIDLSLLDPQSWEEPKETFPVEVVVSEIRWSDPRYNQATPFRPAFPYRGPGYGPEGNSIQQWDLRLKRLDAVYVLQDGTEAPVILYSTCDLEKFDPRTGTFRPLRRGPGKEQMIIEAWTRIVGPLVAAPGPARLVGYKVMVERYREKQITPDFRAKNVILPVELLPPDYQYTGQLTKIAVRSEENVAAASGAETGIPSAVAAAATSSDPIAAASALQAFLLKHNLDANTVTEAILEFPDFPNEARVEPFISLIRQGNLGKVLGSLS
jgi:hypothetical protein